MGIAGVNKKHKIKLKVNLNDKKLEIPTKPIGKCKFAHKKNGCVVVPHNETMTVTFDLDASADWHFTEFKVCAGITKPADCELKDWQASEFAVALKTGAKKESPKLTGIVDLVKLSDKPIRKFKLYDYNGNVQDYFYSITACRESDGKKSVSQLTPRLKIKEETSRKSHCHSSSNWDRFLNG